MTVLPLPTPASRRRFVAIALAVPLLLAGLALWLGQEFRAADTLSIQASTSFNRASRAGALIAHISDAEASQRGYVITGDTRFLAPYGPARARAEAVLTQLDGQFADAVAQAERYESLSRAARRKFAEMDEVIAKRRVQGAPAAIAQIRRGEGRQLMEIIRARAAAMLTAEHGIRAARLAAYNRHARQMQRLIWSVVAVISVLLAIGLYLIWRQRAAQRLTQIAAYGAAERNRAVLDSTVDAIIILNPSGTIESVNPAAERMLGYIWPELERRDIGVLIDLAPGTGSFHERIGLIDDVLRNPFLSDREVRHRDGSMVAVDIALGVMRVPEGNHVIASLRDISARRNAEAMKDEFISTVSHELRTPLTSVVGALGLLRGGQAGALPAPATRLIEIAENNSRRLIRLINDMLDIDRLQSGRLSIDRATIDLRDVVRLACEGSEGLAAAASVRIACTTPDAPVPVSGDIDRLLQVVTNLASNAIRVSPSTGVITLSCTQSDAGKATVTVDDDGPGVPPDFRDRIFGRFERADYHDGVGTGLGLAISREIIERHDGRIWFEDRAEGGTRFTFELDALRPATPTVADTASILICEDDADMAAMLRDMVEAIGYRAHCVDSAAGARAALASGSFIALLLDLNLPDENGLTLAHSLHTADGAPVVPIIIVSGQGRDGTDPPVPFDIVDWINKPVDARRLSRAIDLAVRPMIKARPTILHLDDDRDMLEITASGLESEARVLHASDLTTARALLQTEAPDVVILDIHLAQGNGLDLLPMLIDGKGRAVPTILYSAYDVGPDAAEMVDAVIVKSRGSLPDLRATIRRVLNRHEEEKA